MKKILSILIIMIIISAAILPAGVLASSASASLTGPSTVRVGDTITINYSINGQDILGSTGEINYNTSNLTLSGTTQKIGSSWMVEFNNSSGKIKYVAYDNNQTNPINSNKVLFTMTFKVKNINSGDSISVNATSIEVSNGQTDIDIKNTNYIISISAPLSGNANLSSLTVDSGTLSPSFDKNVIKYSISVPFSISKINVSAKAEDSSAKVKVDNPSLKAGTTTNITITVTAENGIKKVYTIAVSREKDPNYKQSNNANLSSLSVSQGLISPVFSSASLNYVVYLPFEIKSIKVQAKAADSKAKSISVNGGDNLIVGDNKITVICTAENGEKKTYIIIAKRAKSEDGQIDTQTVTKGPDLELIKNQITGSKANETINVDLSAVDNKVLDNKVFNELSIKKDVKININLDGAKITFNGSDIAKINEDTKYDFTYTPNSEYKDTIITEVGKENEAFIYSFAYHGKLPGKAKFNITTDFAENIKVNVYKYDVQTQKYIAIAENINVSAGGVVSYINDSCSDYVITDKQISNAVKSDMVSKQEVNLIKNTTNTADDSKAGYSIWFIIASLIIGLILGFFINKLYKKIIHE